MKKLSRPKPKPLPDTAPAWHTPCSKLGLAVRLSFVRKIKEAMKCETEEAEAVFEGAVAKGEIVEAYRAGIEKDVSFYRMPEK